MREATTSMKIFGRLVNARIVSVLTRLLWLLPSVVNERGTSLAFCLCLRLLRSHTCSKVKVHITARRATKFKTTKFNSGDLIELFTKISTHENNPLYGMCVHVHVWVCMSVC